MTYAYIINQSVYADIDGVPLDTPAWTTTQMDDLRSSAELRGSDVLIPGAAGYRAMPRRPTIAKATIELAVMGFYDCEGNLHADAAEGLVTNEDHLLNNVAALPLNTDHTRTLTLHLPGYTRASLIHVERLRFAHQGPTLSYGQLEVTLLAGEVAST